MQVTVDKSSIKEIGKIIASLGANINKELAAVVNKTTKQSRTAGARDLRKSIKLRAKVLKRAIYIGKPASEKQPKRSVNVRITLTLKFFEPQQRAAGVSYDIGAKDKSHAFITHAFVVKKFGNSVYKRAGKKRLPIIEQKLEFDSEAAKQAAQVCEATAREKLPTQMQARIRFLTLKAKGQLRGNQKR